MKKHTIYCGILLAGFAVAGCSSGSATNESGTAAASVADSKFGTFKNNFIEALWKVYPGWANSQGYHKYDSILVVPDAKSREKEHAFINTYLDSLNAFKPEQLGANDRTDFYMIRNQLESSRWALDTFKEYEWNPAAYNLGDAFGLLLSENYAPLDARLHSVGHKLENVPAYYAAARQNIKQPTLEHTRLAIAQNKGVAEIFTKQIPDTLKKSGLPEAEKQKMLADARAAATAVNDYVKWLEDRVAKEDKNQASWRSFRLGRELYTRKFTYDLQSGFTPDEIYGMATKRKAEIHEEMAKRTEELWTKYFGNKPRPADKLKMIRMMLDTLAATHATPQGFQASVEKQLPELVDFINKKNLIYIDPKKPLVVRRTPDYMAGFSVASINAPGPYAKGANTYYNVDDVTAMDPKRAESHLREYNKYTLQIINIHEAIPGHYTQLVYSNQSPSMIKSIFGSGNMVEGWAVYTERMMLEQGYGNNSPELWLMYYKWHLRSVCNTILDYSLHLRNMSEAEALHLLRDEAFQEETEARGKFKRASLSQVQLCSYFTGYTEIYTLREELKKKQGDKFSLKQFHEKFLSYGSAPVKYIRMLMME